MKRMFKKSIQQFNRSAIVKHIRRVSPDFICGYSWFNHFVIIRLQKFVRTDFRIGGTLLLFLIVIVFTAFQSNNDTEPPQITKEQLRQERLQNRLTEFQKSVEKNCREDVMFRASEMVDSILIARAKASRDTIAKPPRPERPVRPEFRSPTDSTPIAPLLKNDSIGG